MLNETFLELCSHIIQTRVQHRKIILELSQPYCVKATFMYFDHNKIKTLN